MYRKTGIIHRTGKFSLVGKFSLGNRMCILLSESRALEEDGEENGRSQCRRRGNEIADFNR